MNLLAVRRLDNLGRIVLPSDIRNRLGLDRDGNVEFLENTNHDIVLRGTLQKCAVCQTTTHLIPIYNTFICKACKEHIALS